MCVQDNLVTGGASGKGFPLNPQTDADFFYGRRLFPYDIPGSAFICEFCGKHNHIHIFPIFTRG